MTLQLPDVVQAYFAVTNGGDAAQLASCFRSDATVSDERKHTKEQLPSKPGNRRHVEPLSIRSNHCMPCKGRAD